jgi:hypothetical protein
VGKEPLELLEPLQLVDLARDPLLECPVQLGSWAACALIVSW